MEIRKQGSNTGIRRNKINKEVLLGLWLESEPKADEENVPNAKRVGSFISSTVHFHVSSFVHVHFSINTPQARDMSITEQKKVPEGASH